MSNIIITDKMLDTITIGLKQDARLLVLEGAARSSKTADIIQAFYWAVMDSAEKYHLIAGQDYDTINRNILYADNVGLLETYPHLKIKKKQMGGYYIEVPGQKEKEIIVAGYADASKWKKILGGSLGVVLIDEVNIADETFVNETFARQTASEKPITFFTLNGDDPEHFIYNDYINYCAVVGAAPTSTLNYMKSFQKEKGTKDGYYYIYYKMEDNPKMTPLKLERAMNIYPAGSYYHLTKILGERGKQGSLIYADYMSDNLIVDAWRGGYDFIEYTVGIDIAETKAKNIFVLVGWTAGYKSNVVLTHLSFGGLGYQEKKEKLEQWLNGLRAVININKISGLFVDSAEANFIRDLQDTIELMFGLKVLPSYKATIKERIDMNIIAFATRRTLFDHSQTKPFHAFKSAVWVKGKEGKERQDDGDEKADLRDAVEYAQTRHMKKLMRGGL